MLSLVSVALGSALGGSARYLTNEWVIARLGAGFPFGTMTVNIIGSLILGLLAGLVVSGSRPMLPDQARLLFMTGFCGSYTTFSTFSLQTLELFEAGYPLRALANILGSLILCLSAVYLGVILGNALSRP